MKFSACNETFRSKSLDDALSFIGEIGFDAVEIAPWTLVDRGERPSEKRVEDVRKSAESAGLEVAGIHWVFGAESPFHITHPD